MKLNWLFVPIVWGLVIITTALSASWNIEVINKDTIIIDGEVKDLSNSHVNGLWWSVLILGEQIEGILGK